MIKKVVIAAAGQGTRMLHLTKNKPKPLIKIRKRPFLAYLFDNIFKAGYKEIILVVGYKAEKFKEFLKNYKPPKGRKCKIQIVNQFEIVGTKKYGTACALMAAEDIIGKENFIIVYGDNLYSTKDLVAFNIDDNYNYAQAFSHKHPEKYAALVLDGEYLKKIVEKPKKYISNLIPTGLYKFTPEVFDKLSKLRKSRRGEYEVSDLVLLLAKERKVKVKMVQDYWVDFGNPADIIKFSHFLKTSKSFK